MILKWWLDLLRAKLGTKLDVVTAAYVQLHKLVFTRPGFLRTKLWTKLEVVTAACLQLMSTKTESSLSTHPTMCY